MSRTFETRADIEDQAASDLRVTPSGGPGRKARNETVWGQTR